MSYLNEIRLSRQARGSIPCPPSSTPIWDSQLISDQIQKGATVRIWSSILCDWVLWVRDERIRTIVESKYSKLAIYTLMELEIMVQQCWSTEQLRIVHGTKKELGATITA